MKRLIPALFAAGVAILGCTKEDLLDNADTTKTDPGLEWSAAACTATIGASDNVFPTLTNDHKLAVKYSSTDSAVATIDSATGEITLVARGSTSIVATSEETSVYSSGNAAYVLTVTKKGESVISWSESACTVKYGDTATYSFPTLSNPGNQNITYSSSNNNVATINSDGLIDIIAEGVTTITASSEANESCQALSVSYTLYVASGDDEGAGTYTFESTGDPTSDDDISNTVFARMITVTYSGTSATVEGDYYGYAAVDGAHVTVTNTKSDENIIYKLTGTTSNGSFKLYSAKKQAILLDGVSITNPSGAAINNQSSKRTFVMVEGTNTLADGSSAAYTSVNEDLKAVFFSEGQLIFSGSGTLTVSANNAKEKSCIASDDYVRILKNPTLKLTSSKSAGHGIKGKDGVILSSGNTTISSAGSMKKGITSEDYVLVEDGTHTITVTGSAAYDSEDAEYKGTAGIKADNYFGMTGGTVTITNSGTGGKGLRAGSYDYDATNHAVADSYISGGTLKITTTGSEYTTGDVSSKGIKIGWVTKSGTGERAKVTGYAGNLLISGGSVQVSVSKSEGIEAKGNIVISGGEVYVTSSGDDAINSQAEFDVTGGYVYAYSSANDAMDANHDMNISGGYVFAITTKGSPEVALDANTEENYKLYITGGVVVAYGGLERGYSSSNTVYTLSGTANAWNALYNGSSFIAAFKAPSGLSSFAVCAPSLKSGYKGVSVSGTTYANGVWATSGISGGSSVTLSTYSGGNSGGGPGGGGPGGWW